MNYKKSQDTSINETLIAQIIFVVVVTIGVLFFERFFKIESSSVDKSRGQAASLMLDFENMKRMFEGEVVEKMTILDALNASVTAGQIKLLYTVDINNDTAVVGIDDHIAVGDKNFSFHINGKKLNTKDLNRTFVDPGDTITVRLE
jgi:hypothetical protein